MGKLKTTATSSCKVSSLVTKLGLTNTTSRWSFRARSGEKKIVWYKAKIGNVDHVFWLPWNCSRIGTWKLNCPRSFWHGENCLKDCVRCVQPNLLKEACRILHHENVCVLCVDSVQVFSTKFHHSAETPSLCARFCPLWQFLVLQMQTGSPMAAFRGCDYNFRGNDIAAKALNRRLPRMLPAMEEVEPVYCLSWGVFWLVFKLVELNFL